MLSPAKMKFRKYFKGKIHGIASSGYRLSFGAYGLKAVEPARITAEQIEAARRTITRRMKRIGKVWIRIYPNIPVTQKPAEVRMGSGKGGVEYWACRVYPGTILFEMDGVDESLAKEALALAAAKLPISTKIIVRGV
jgi:large subunit ribosomal protein L16